MRLVLSLWQRVAQPRACTIHLCWSIGCAVLWLLGSTVLCTHGAASPGVLHSDTSGERPSEAACLTAAVPSASPRWADYLRLKHKTQAWFDQLDVDPVELLKHGVKGKKKLAEILDAYLSLYQHMTDARARARIQQRVAQLAQHTQRPAYHDMLRNSDAEFLQNSMSYLRVLWLLEHFGHETTAYRQQLLAVKPRLDEHLKRRGAWQRAMFAEYYTRFGLDKPPELSALPDGVISRRLPLAQYDRDRAYQLTHEVFVAFDYGLQRLQHSFTPADVAYLRAVLPILADASRQQQEQDLLAELLLCMTYLGWHTAQGYCEGINYLLDSQNPNGTWGSYEALRQVGGPYLDQRVYLHTTLVVMKALLAAYEGGWRSVE